MVLKQGTAQQPERSSMKPAQGKSSDVRDTAQAGMQLPGWEWGKLHRPLKSMEQSQGSLRLSATDTDNVEMGLDTCNRGAEGHPIAFRKSTGCHQHQERCQEPRSQSCPPQTILGPSGWLGTAWQGTGWLPIPLSSATLQVSYCLSPPCAGRI